VDGPFEHGNERTGSINAGKILNSGLSRKSQLIAI
jgi:hypothetical protein